ncbi:hypothetical protein COMNV_00770 [Commensalibacter sp. Nvir]|uniref:NADH dehydrogenase ubiquinone Fe-S protein 4 n=1 Tax=Commensalibacter sp. Nvir TaxID=3069817 RepID=UPI002D53DFF9|nr:hypothetical protein COMNV_00770 [Commensalibacter sp. Nvir]
MIKARIYKREKKVTQSGSYGSHLWVFDYGHTAPRHHDPLMGWIGSKDTRCQITLSFPTKELAVLYAKRHSILYEIDDPGEVHYVVKDYEENFHNRRKMNWTH